MVWGAVIGGVASLASGALGKGGNNNAWAEYQTHLGREADRVARDVEYRRQKEFAQMGIRWRVRDAKRAGLHPLAALGMQPGAGYSPQSVAGSIVPSQETPGRDYSGLVDGALSAMGQNTARAQTATMTPEEREMQELAIRNARLRNSVLELELSARAASLLQPANPPMPSSVAPAGAVEIVPARQVSADRKDPSIAASRPPSMVRHRLSDNRFVDLPSQEMAEGIEAAPPGTATAIWAIRAWDRFWNGFEKPKIAPPRAGQAWVWSPLRQAWELRGGYKDTASRRVGRPANHWDHR